jgi:hypothetical protein
MKINDYTLFREVSSEQRLAGGATESLVVHRPSPAAPVVARPQPSRAERPMATDALADSNDDSRH